MYKSQSSLASNLEEDLENHYDNPYTMRITNGRVLLSIVKNAYCLPSKYPTPAYNYLLRGPYHEASLAAFLTPKRNLTAKPAQSAEPAQPTVTKGKQNLLRFPAYPLEDTIKLFLETCEPLISGCEMRETKEAAEQLLTGEHKKLQELLEEAAKNEENWLAHRWLKYAYMQYREPVTVFSSPGMTLPLQEFCSEEEFITYAAKCIYILIKYKAMVDNDEIPVHKVGKNELDNSQFKKVFGTVRRPCHGEDKLEQYPCSKHIAVAYNNNFYKVNVYDRKDQPLHFKTLIEELQKIVERERECRGLPIGVLTSSQRDDWAAAYQELMKNPENEFSIREIETALFTVSLDNRVDADEPLEVLCSQLIHGGGTEQNSNNRWMDKTIQLVINPNGISGFTYEHSPAEGQPIAQITDYITLNLNNDKFFECGACDDYRPPCKLNFVSNDAIEDHICKASVCVNALATNLEMRVLHYKGFGKEFLKQQKFSPDSFIQIALQYAFYKMHHTPGAAYESAHLRIFTGGRTETIRSCSKQAIEFAKAMLDDCCDDKHKIESLREAINTHRQYVRLALQGRGVDRHLLGLKLMALENNLPVPELYQSPGFVKSAHFRLSTSQVASDDFSFMCYGPLTEDGYSCCYNPRKDDIILAIGSWAANDETNSCEFADVLSECFDTLHCLLSKASAGDDKPAKAKL